MGGKVGLLFRKSIGLVDRGLVAVSHEIIAEIMRLDKNNQGSNGREMKE